MRPVKCIWACMTGRAPLAAGDCVAHPSARGAAARPGPCPCRQRSCWPPVQQGGEQLAGRSRAAPGRPDLLLALRIGRAVRAAPGTLTGALHRRCTAVGRGRLGEPPHALGAALAVGQLQVEPGPTRKRVTCGVQVTPLLVVTRCGAFICMHSREPPLALCRAGSQHFRARCRSLCRQAVTNGDFQSRPPSPRPALTLTHMSVRSLAAAAPASMRAHNRRQRPAAGVSLGRHPLLPPPPLLLLLHTHALPPHPRQMLHAQQRKLPPLTPPPARAARGASPAPLASRKY